MPLIVTARSSKGEILSEHTSFLNALAQAMSLSASGMTEVRIADGSGPARTPAELYRSMFGGDGGKPVCESLGSVARTSLAA